MAEIMIALEAMADVMIALGIFVLGFLVFGASVFLVRRFVHFSVLQPNNETVPHYLGIVIGLYGIFSGFVIASLWEQQRQAEDNLVHEASELRTIFRLAGALEEPTRGEIQSAALAYAKSVLTTEWRTLSTGRTEDIEILDHTHPEKNRIWEALTAYAREGKESPFFDPLVEHFEILSDSRRSRSYDAQRALPTYLWMILILGSVLSVACTLLIGTENLRTQALLTGISGGLLSLLLFVVHDLQSPFRGYWSAEPRAFHLAQERMEFDLRAHAPARPLQSAGGDEVHP